MKRKGTAGSEELEGNLSSLGGRPRSVEGMPAELRGARRRRHDREEIELVSCRLFMIFLHISFLRFKTVGTVDAETWKMFVHLAK